MRTDESHTWADRLTAPGVALLAAVLSVGATTLADATPAVQVGEPLLPLAVGTTVGVALAANGRHTRVAAVAGGLFANFLHCIVISGLPFARFAGYLVETLLALAGGLALFRFVYRDRLAITGKPPPTYAPGLLSLVATCTAALASYGFLYGSTDAGIGFWVFSHGIGTFAAAGALQVGRSRWLYSANPANNSRELAVALLALVAATTATFGLNTAWIWVGTSICLLLAVRFGTKLAQPVTLAFIIAIDVGGSQQWGVAASQPQGPSHFVGVSGVIVVVAVVGRLARTMDDSVRAQHRSAQQWRKLAQRGGFDAFVDFDESHRIALASDGIVQYTGMTSQQVRGLRIEGLIEELIEDGSESFSAAIDRVVAGQTVRLEHQFTITGGSIIWALCIIEPHQNNGGFTLYMLDITNTRRTVEDGVESRATSADIEERERRRLAQLVHDGALQDLAAADLLIGAARLTAEEANIASQSYERRIDVIAAQLQRVESLLTSGMRQLRVDAIGSPTIDLRDGNVGSSLQRTIDKFSTVHSATIDLVERELEGVSPHTTRIGYQIAQEAVVNAILHSQAATISIDLGPRGNGYSVIVSDDGLGFEPDLLQEVGHLGLSAMSTLAHEAGGWISLSTQPGLGTTVEAWIPVAGRTAANESRTRSRLVRRSAARRRLEEQQAQLELPSRPLQADSTNSSS